jgi:hypothetical protein
MRQKVALLLLLYVTRRFLAGLAPATYEEAARHLAVPVELVAELTQGLVTAGLACSPGTDGSNAWSWPGTPELIRITT